MPILAKFGDFSISKVNAKFSKGVDFWKFGELTEEDVEAKKWQKIAKNLHRMGTDVQKLAYLSPRQHGETALSGSEKADFRARITPQAELFLVVILNIVFIRALHSFSFFNGFR